MAQTRPQGLLYRIPVIGRIMTELHQDEDAILYLIAALVSIAAICALQFGLFVVTMVALVEVFVMFVCLILITRG